MQMGNNLVAGKNLMDGIVRAIWQGAAMGGLGGAIGGGWQGYQNARDNGLNYFWGTKPDTWAYNRNQWSLAWWDKPEVVKFKVHNYGAGILNCRAKALQNMYGGTEEEWWQFSNKSSLDRDYIRAFRNKGADIMQYPVENNNYVNFNEISNLQKSGGKAIYTVENYHGGLSGHAMTVRKIKYIPNKRFDLQIINPETGTIEWIRNFNNYNWSYGTEPHLWYICW